MNKSELIKSFLKSLKEQSLYWKRSFLLIWSATPKLTAIWSILLIIQGVLPGLLVYLTKIVVDSLMLAVNNKGDWESVRIALFYIALTGILMILNDVIQSLMEMVRSTQADIIQDYVKELVHTKSSTVDLAHFESPEYHDRLEQATTDGASRPLALLESIGSLVQNTITLIVMAGLLTRYSLWLPLILIFSTLPAFVIVLKYDREYHKWWKQTTGDRRWINYFDYILTDSESVPEMRVFNLNPFFQSKYQSLRKGLRTEKLHQMRRLSIAKFLSGLLSLGILAVAIGWMGWRAFSGLLTLGDLALFYQAFDRGQGLMRSLFSNFGQMIKTSLFLSVLFEFLDLDSKIKDPEFPITPPLQLKKGIAIRNITFRYPGTTQPIFDNFTLFIPASKSVAIVGENGSGKSTLIKLLCRFYDPDVGSIEFDNIDIKRFTLKHLLRMITIMFQLPLYYHASVKEAITLSDLESKAKIEDVEIAAQSAGADEFIKKLSDGYETSLGRIHSNGAELSGGQWQRLALARAYFRQAPIVLLDEPTSFLDSWSEADWFNRFRELTKNKTAVIVTHRLTIAMKTDLIIVMDKGKISEMGSHQELLNLNGLYAKSWNEQMQLSVKKTNLILEKV